MIINVAQPNNAVSTTKQMIEFIEYVCKEVVSEQSVLKARRGEHLEGYEIEFIVKPVSGLNKADVKPQPSRKVKSQQDVQRTAKLGRPRKKDYFNPVDVAILGGDPSL